MKISYNIWRRILGLYYGFLNLGMSLTNLWAWLPIIWRDQDDDYWFLYRIIAFKIRRMQSNIAMYGYHVGKDKDVKNMAICAHVLEQFINESTNISTIGRETELLEMFSKVFARHSLRWWT